VLKEFHMFVSDILRQKGHQVVKAHSTDTVLSVVRQFARHRIGAVVVEDAWMRAVGIFSERDFVNAAAEHGAAALAMTVDKLMSSPIVSCALADKVESAMTTMTLAKIRHLPVMEDGKLLGIVSIGDLVKHRLEEKALEANVLLDRARMRA
jgi:CBS domain-containing protein